MRTPWLVVGIVIGVAAVGGGAVALGAIPDSSGVIHGCYNPSQGYKLRVLDTAKTATCPTGWKPLNWNQTGPRGLQGVQGIQGVQGPAGVSGYTTATATDTIACCGSTAMTVKADCPSGKVPVGGGFDLGNAFGGVPWNTLQDGPTFVRDANNAITGGGWIVRIGV